MKKNIIFSLFIVGVLVLLNACYTFSSTTIDYNTVKTFSIENIQNKATNTPPNLHIDFTERLKDKIRNGTRLKYVDNNGDIEFSGNIVKYAISSVAPKPGENIGLQRLTIEVSIQFKNTKQKDQNWNNNFSQWGDFSADQDFSSVQERLNTDVFNLILNDIFNKSFANW